MQCTKCDYENPADVLVLDKVRRNGSIQNHMRP
jgi:hypothetical protein